jgi:hypothetical protein
MLSCYCVVLPVKGCPSTSQAYRTTSDTLFTLVALLILPVARPTFADPNPPVDNPIAVTIPAGAWCTFAVDVIVGGKFKEVELPQGRVLQIYPGGTYALTNHDEPTKTVTAVTTGSFHYVGDPNGAYLLVMTGRNLWFDAEGRLVFLIGRFTEQVDSEGTVIQPLHGTGRTIDACALIA